MQHWRPYRGGCSPHDIYVVSKPERVGDGSKFGAFRWATRLREEHLERTCEKNCILLRRIQIVPDVQSAWFFVLPSCVDESQLFVACGQAGVGL